jgi:hypothetical protein
MNLLLLIPLTLLLAPQDNPREIVKKSRDQARVSGMEAKSVLEIHDGKGNTRVRETSMASKLYSDGTEKRVIVFLSPADVKGTSMLINDYPGKEDDMWIYMPALRKTRKIVSSEKNKNFMGSEFTNADLATENLDDFTYSLEGTEKIGDQNCWKIKLTPATPALAAENGISFKITWISQSDYVPRKTIFHGPDGAPVRELLYSGIRLLDKAKNKYMVTHMEIKNLKNNRFSIMDMPEVLLNPQVKDEYFTLTFIEKQ